MAYQELPQVIGRWGREKIGLSNISFLNALGFMGGLLVGQGLAPAFGHGLLSGAVVVGCIAAGIYLTLDYHGMLVARRVGVALRFWQRRALRRTLLDGWTLAPAPPAPTSELAVEVVTGAGKPLFTPVRRR